MKNDKEEYIFKLEKEVEKLKKELYDLNTKYNKASNKLTDIKLSSYVGTYRKYRNKSGSDTWNTYMRVKSLSDGIFTVDTIDYCSYPSSRVDIQIRINDSLTSNLILSSDEISKDEYLNKKRKLIEVIKKSM